MTAPWVLPVPLLPDELLSAWLVRAALTQGCDPLVFTGSVWPGVRLWNLDLDRRLGATDLDRLSGVSGVPLADLVEASLANLMPELALTPPNDLAVWPWVLSLGSRNRRRRGGLQCCLACLRSDRTPYFRRVWRLAWHTCCPRHGDLLSERCSNCQARLEPHRLQAEEGDLATCHSCKSQVGSVRDGSPAADAAALVFQQRADQVVAQRQGTYGPLVLTAPSWFQLARYFIALARRAARGQSERVVQLMTALGVASQRLLSPATGLALEMLPVSERAVLVSTACTMLDAGPERFLMDCRTVGLTLPSLHDRGQVLPACITELLTGLDGAEPRITRRQSNPPDRPKPRSQRAVMQMHARLQRKM